MAERYLHAISEPRRVSLPGRKTIAAVVAVLTLCVGVAATIVRSPRPLLLWNASSSSPLGLYLVTGRDRLKAGEIVVAWAPAAARRIAAQRSYLPMRVPLVKRIAATAGERVCAKHLRIVIDEKEVAARRSRDPSGRPMPSWSGCVRLRTGELFLLSKAGPLAFDGRYFGVTRSTDVVGRAKLLWGLRGGGVSRG